MCTNSVGGNTAIDLRPGDGLYIRRGIIEVAGRIGSVACCTEHNVVLAGDGANKTACKTYITVDRYVVVAV